jgi:transposase InsO family protein
MFALTMPRGLLSCTSWRKETRDRILGGCCGAKLGIRIERAMTDNGSCYRSFRAACDRLGLRQVFTKHYSPKTNGKAERFIQTALRERVYAHAGQN